MPRPSAEFEAYLAPDETLVASVDGRFVDGDNRSTGTIGVTDRRLLMVGDSDRFETVAHDAVCSIRSDRRRTRTTAGLGYPLLAVGGVVVAVVSLLLAMSLGPSAVAIGLAAAAVGGSVIAEWLRRASLTVDPAAVDVGRAVLRGESSVGRLADVGILTRGEGEGLVIATAIGAQLALVGLVAATGSLVVVPLVLAALLALGFADAAARRARRLVASGAAHREERTIRVDLVNGQTVALAVDTEARLDRALSGVVREPLAADARQLAPTATAGAAGSHD